MNLLPPSEAHVQPQASLKSTRTGTRQSLIGTTVKSTFTGTAYAKVHREARAGAAQEAPGGAAD